VLCCCLMLGESVEGTTGSGNFGSIWRGDPMSKFLGTDGARPQCENVPVTLSTLLKTTKLSRSEKVIKGTCDWPNGARPQCENVPVTLSTLLKLTKLSRFEKVIKVTCD
jgi:hypothetical protein